MEEENHLKLKRKTTKKAKYTANYQYQLYKKKWGKSARTQKEYSAVTDYIYERIVEVIIKDEWIFHLPLRMGDVGIFDAGRLGQYTGKERGIKVNYGASAKASKEAGKKIIVYYENKNTDGRIFRIKWYKGKCKFPGQKYYTFKPTRDKFKRALARHIKAVDGNVTYIKKD
tara:strand:+ start:586 stop:1098 length:513 start_codon:yes stop_codon:yes gene_type:complete